MVTDGGGWTIVGAVTGADNEEPFTSNVAVDGDPFKVRGSYIHVECYSCRFKIIL